MTINFYPKIQIKLLIDKCLIIRSALIILEYFTATSGQYSCTVYESKDHSCRSYIAPISIKNGRRVIDSLKTTDVKDYILPMVLKGELDEIIEQGEKSRWTPPTSVIISILKKNEDGKDFEKKTISTTNFYPDDAF